MIDYMQDGAKLRDGHRARFARLIAAARLSVAESDQYLSPSVTATESRLSAANNIAESDQYLSPSVTAAESRLSAANNIREQHR